MAADQQRKTMFPIQSILNRNPPPPPSPTTVTTKSARPHTPSFLHAHRFTSEPPSPASDLDEDAVPGLTPSAEGRLVSRGRSNSGSGGAGPKKTRDSSDLSYTVPQGPIKYPPHEDLNEEQMRMVAAFAVVPFGHIRQWCAHISYSSEKKDVFEKTGRESFHVFVYKFTDPTDRQSYDVMWDYVGGFVRISPFFKSRKHKKTGPAKMLDLNKGLRDVTFHMTGGNRIAQGYWVPFHCARAVCATFCYPIAGALIPIFGPSFPEDCVEPDSPRYGRMVIDERVVREAKHEIAAYRHAGLAICPPRGGNGNGITSHPRRIHHQSLDATRHGPSQMPAFDHHPQQQQRQEQCLYGQHYHQDVYALHDSRGGAAMASTGWLYPHPTSVPIQNMPWSTQNGLEAGDDVDRLPAQLASSTSSSSFTTVNHQAMRPDPLRAIHPQLILESQQQQQQQQHHDAGGRGSNPVFAYKRAAERRQPPPPPLQQRQHRRFESEATPPAYKRARLQAQMPTPGSMSMHHDVGQRFPNQAIQVPKSSSRCDIPGPAPTSAMTHQTVETPAAVTSENITLLIDRRGGRSRHRGRPDERRQKYFPPLGRTRGEGGVSPPPPADYTIEELQAAQVLATITYPSAAAPPHVVAEKTAVEKNRKNFRTSNTPRKRARSI